MGGPMPRMWRTLLVCMSLTACTSLAEKAPPAPVYDVKTANVVAGPTISPELIAGVTQRVNAAIAATTRYSPLPQVTLNIRIVSVEKGAGVQKDRNVARVDIDASSIQDGSVVGMASFESTTFAPDPTSVDQLMAEDIAARLRSTFALVTPPLGS
jgi:hypothetical protein